MKRCESVKKEIEQNKKEVGEKSYPYNVALGYKCRRQDCPLFGALIPETRRKDLSAECPMRKISSKP